MRIGTIVRTLVVGACIAYMLFDVDFSRMQQALSIANGWEIILCQAYVFFMFLPPALRLSFLASQRISFLSSLKAITLSLGVNNLLPAKLGEVAKILSLRQSGILSLPQSVDIVFWERFADLQAMLLMALATSFGYRQIGIAFPLIGVVAAIWLMLFTLRKFPNTSNKLIALLPKKRIQPFAQDTVSHLRQPKSLTFYTCLTGHSIAVWGSCLLQYFLVFNLAFNLDMSWIQILTVFIVSSVGMAIPSSPGALGVYEAAVVASLKWFGIEHETALACAVILRFTQYIPTSLGSIWIMSRSGMNLKHFSRKLTPEAQ